MNGWISDSMPGMLVKLSSKTWMHQVVKDEWNFSGHAIYLAACPENLGMTGSIFHCMPAWLARCIHQMVDG